MDWTTWKPASCLPHCWCEAARTGSFILEPVNTWTNLGFILAGIYFFFQSSQFSQSKNPFKYYYHLPKVYGFALFFVGAGSFFFHASQTFVGQWFDVFGMYLVSTFYIYYNLIREGKIDQRRFTLLYALSVIVLGGIIIILPETRRWLFGVTIAIALLQSIWIAMKKKLIIKNKYLIYSVISYATAQTFWIIDKNGTWCNPYASWINGHGLWHLLTCSAAIFIFLYFHSEEDPAWEPKTIA